MKRDFGLIREILIRVEAIPAGGILNKFDIDDFKEEEVLYHIGLLEEEKLIKASISESSSKSGDKII